MGIAFVTELWLQNKNPLHQRELERRQQLEGYTFFTNSRATQRGGGVGVVVNTNLGYSGKKLQINSRVGRNSLEVVWVLVTPPSPVNGIDKFICVCIYSPPRSRLHDILFEHLRFNFSSLNVQFSIMLAFNS